MTGKLSITGFIVLISLTAAFAGRWGMEGAFLQTAALSAIATTQTAGDCNDNGVPDDEDIAAGTSQDCNQNGRPDECDFIAELTATGTAYTEGETPRAVLNAAFFYVYPPTASDRFVGQVSPTEYMLKDIAVDPTNRQIYTVNVPSGVAFNGVDQYLYLVDAATGAGTPLPQPTGQDMPVLGLTFGQNGTLYGIGPAGFVTMDKATGAISQTVNANVFGLGMATSATGDIYSITIEMQQPDDQQTRQPIGTSILQLHDKATGDVLFSVPVVDPLQGERQIIDIAFGADGQLYGIAGYIYLDPPYYVYFAGAGLVLIDPATGGWTDIGDFNGELAGLGGPRDPASLDCNENGIPDECEPDCNANGIPDECDIAAGTSKDCNGNRVPDECDLANGTSRDCNDNRIPDECDLAGGRSADLDGDGVPDECQTPEPAPEEQPPPEAQPTPGGPLCVLFLFQSVLGIPLCGPCWLVGMVGTLVGLGGMKWYARRRFR